VRVTYYRDDVLTRERVSGPTTRTKDDKVLSHFVGADETGRINMSMWDEDTTSINPGDIFRIAGGYGF
jgi:hypothetical protein